MAFFVSEFEGNPLEVVAKRTQSAHRDFEDWRVSSDRQDSIAKSLKQVPWSENDAVHGDIKIRSTGDGFEVAFVLVSKDDAFIILVIGYDQEGVMETQMSFLTRAASEGLHPSVKTLLEGRRRKRDC